MDRLRNERVLGDVSADDELQPTAGTLLARLGEIDDALAGDPPPEGDARLALLNEKGFVLADLERHEEAWRLGEETFRSALVARNWLRAVEGCELMFRADQGDSVKALAHGIWLAVTFPVPPELSVAMLQNLVDESPDRSDAAAVAAATARYLVDLRATGRERDELTFFTNQLIGEVARRHSQVEEQEIFDFWVEQLGLSDPGRFLPALARALDLMVGDTWWFDRDALRALIPDDA